MRGGTIQLLPGTHRNGCCADRQAGQDGDEGDMLVYGYKLRPALVN
jgi:hypothetical protein